MLKKDMQLPTRLGFVSKFNRILRFDYWISPCEKNSIVSGRLSLPTPRRFIYSRKPTSSVNSCDRNSSSNRKFERVARYVNKGIMSTMNVDGHSTSSGPNDETDDISLTFWICLWGLLAIVASWIYTKLNSSKEAIEDGNTTSNVDEPEADERIARKLVNEISRKDLVKQSTFRRQRSYEIIDGEVRIHYDVSLDRSSQETTNYNGNIVDSAEVESFPIRKSSLDEMEQILPGNLPRIIEEGEEEIGAGREVEVEEVVPEQAVISTLSESYPVSNGDTIAIPAIKVIDYDSELNRNLNFQDTYLGENQEELTKFIELSSGNDNPVRNEITDCPEAEQTNITETITTGGKKESDAPENRKIKTPVWIDNSSSDETSSTSEESVIENIQSTSFFCNRNKASTTSNTTTSSVYKLTEVSGNEEENFTVTRGEVKTFNTCGVKSLESAAEGMRQFSTIKPQHFSLTTSGSSKELVECFENEKQPDNKGRSSAVVRTDKSYHDGMSPTNSPRSIKSKQNITTTKERTTEECVTSIQEKVGNAEPRLAPRNVHEPEISDLTNRKSLNTSVDQVDGVDNSCGEPNSPPQLDKIEENECDILGKLSLPEMGKAKELTGNIEEGFYQLSRYQDCGDILVDNSGDILFKVIGPSKEKFLGDLQYLEDTEESVEHLGDEYFVLDENENYQMFEPEVEFSKSWRSLPSWEKAHNIRHRELDRDADDSVVESENTDDEQSDDLQNGNFQMVKSEEIISSNIEPILEEPELECVEGIENLKEHSVLQTFTDKFEETKFMATAAETNLNPVATHRYDIPGTLEVILSEAMEDGIVYLPKPDEILREHNRTDNENSNVTKVFTHSEQIVSDNLREAEEIDLKELVQTEEHLQSSSTSEHDKSIGYKLDDGNLKTVAESGNDPKTEYFQDEETCGGHVINAKSSVNGQSFYNPHTDIPNEMKNEGRSDDKVIAVCSNENTTKESVHGVIYANEVTGDQFSLVSEDDSFTSARLVLSHENSETKKFKETSLDDIPVISNPVTVTYVKEQVEGNKSPYHEGTNIDGLSDVDEIDIDDTQLDKYYNKSKSVTDLDQALASYNALDNCASFDKEEEENDINYYGSLSKSVPNILDGFQEENQHEAAIKTKSNTSIGSLAESQSKKNLSVSSPEIAVKSKEGLKKITKIKIVHVKFLEVEDGSGSENIEEDSFTVDGDMLMSGKMKWRSKHFSDDNSQLTATRPFVNNKVVDDHFTAEKTTEKQLEFGFDDLFKNIPPSPSLTQSISSAEMQEQPSSPVHSDININHHSITSSSTEVLPQRERYIAKYGNIPRHSSSLQSKDSLHLGMRLSEKFQLQQDGSSQHKKSSVSSSCESEPQLKHVKDSHLRSQTTSPTSDHSGCLVTVKSGVINDYVYSSDADSETSYNTPPPRIRARKFHRAIVHQDTTDSASSSEPDSPRAKGKTKHKASMSQIFGVQSDTLQHSELQNFTKEDERSGSTLHDSKLFTRFGCLEQCDLATEKKTYGRQDWDVATEGNVGSPYDYQARESMFDELKRYGAWNRGMEFNPFTEVDGYNEFEPFERSHSPTSISSDQSSVISFNCDFEPEPLPTRNFHPEVYTCENPTCRKQDILLGPEKTSFKSCPACFTYYCSSKCRKLHWPAHKQICYFGRVNTYVRSIIRLCQRRLDLSMYLSQLARDGYNKKGRGVVMATFNSPELAREFITRGHDAFSGRKPTYSSLTELSREGVISKHRVALLQAVRDYEPNEEFVFNIAVVAVNDIPSEPAPHYKLKTVLHCIKMPLNEKIVARQPKEEGIVQTRLFALPKCSRHEFVNEMEARRHYCRNLSKNLRLYNIKLKHDYEDCYKKLCMYVEHDIAFEPMTVYGQRSGITYKCIIGPEQSYPLNPEYC